MKESCERPKYIVKEDDDEDDGGDDDSNNDELNDMNHDNADSGYVLVTCDDCGMSYHRQCVIKLTEIERYNRSSDDEDADDMDEEIYLCKECYKFNKRMQLNRAISEEIAEQIYLEKTGTVRKEVLPSEIEYTLDIFVPDSSLNSKEKVGTGNFTF